MKQMACPTMEALIAALREMSPNSRIISGGTDLIIRMQDGEEEPDLLVYMGCLAESKGIILHEDALEIGAAVTMRELENSLCSTETGFAAIADAARRLGSMQVRNTATIGGNLANASPSGDFLPVLSLLHADALIATPKGTLRSAAVEEMLQKGMRNALAYNEAIVKFRIPREKNAGPSAFLKLGFRREVSITRIGLCGQLHLGRDGRIQKAAFMAGAISRQPVRVSEAEKALVGLPAGPAAKETLGHCLRQLICEVAPGRDYKAQAAYGVAEDLMDILMERACS